ncbi:MULTISPECIES: ABC transporter substrate-binding protein [Rhodococcus]|uniref:ABC transporter substrate-binding protein n=1 Tax=Rhodococcus TaxID=1827 RepID=UPI000B5AB795|nr:iron-siderophore ABC transporter substrate-binding protein [Rhodococcus sp. BUPNP1]MXQ78744.1 ABC transporter substrate-binding protein [Rhodococcus rhodochrous]OWY82707.1 iron siderophore-binding protein [Rhodococcus sp. BUPNP1]
MPVLSSRPARFTAALLTAGLLVAGCSSADTSDASSTDPASDSAAGFPRTVEHFRGSTTIENEPTRIVALDTSYSDAVLLLEAPLVGYVDYRTDEFPDYLGDSRQYATDAVSVGKTADVSLEQVAALEPDLILSAEVRDGENYEELSAIAPTVFSQSTGPTWKDNIRLVAQAIGKEDLAEQKISEYEERAAAIGADINAKAGNPTISIVRFAGEPTARLYRTTSFSGIVLEDAGLARPASQGPDPSDPSSIMNAISPELITEAEADVVFVTTYDLGDGKAQAAAEPFVTNPLWENLQGRKVEVDDSVWMMPVSIQGAHRILDDLADTFGVDRHTTG